MSLFLGKIHFWLYNKILWFENIEEFIVQWAKDKGLPAEEWSRYANSQFGEPTGGKPLEEVIDTGNIHGWLQERIASAELRQAAIVTAVLEENPQYKEELTDIFAMQGAAAAAEYENRPNTPDEVFRALNDFILEGMPCDRVNETVSSSEDEFVWETTTCLHTPYWQKVKGNVRNFYDLREAWVKAFVNAVNPAFKYEKLSDTTHRIIRQQEEDIL